MVLSDSGVIRATAAAARHYSRKLVAAMPRKGVERRWNLDHNGIRRVGSKTSGFRYSSAGGATIADTRTLTRIRKLRIPPAWENVRIAKGDAAPLQVLGVDKKGRTQYLYHTRFRQQREEEKFLRVVSFGESLPKLRSRVRRDLAGSVLDRTRVLASIVRLIDQGFFRVGNDKSARSESTYGLTTVHSDHVKVNGSQISFDYVGKWGKKQKQTIRDAEVAAILRRLRKLGGDELFKYLQGTAVHDVKDHHVNDYIQSIIGGEYTAKDFRTWAGTLLCSISLGIQGAAATKTEAKKRIRNAIVATATLLGNTPAVCRSSYICPRVLHEFTEGRTMEMLRKQRTGRPVARNGLSMEERALLKLLRETIADRRKRKRAA
ncbi:MAG TPA: DNA topoisomerase IB [Thermoanaerobaculia bacterium]|nr:DNA topoisomerase IB [Thermoanaerobaculia bacterium]